LSASGLLVRLRRSGLGTHPPGRLTPSEVHRGFRNIRVKTASQPVNLTRPSRPAGRPPGSKNCHPAETWRNPPGETSPKARRRRRFKRQPNNGCSWQAFVMGSPSVAYSHARVTPTAENLASWEVDWAETSASGACPRCGDSTSFTWSAVVAMSGQGKDSTTRRVDCACGRDHPANGDEKQTCGAYWFTRFYRDELGVGHAAPAVDSRVVAAAESLQGAQQDAETRLRAAAGNWVGGVSAVLALFGIASTVAGGTILANLTDTRKLVVVGMTLAAIVAAVLAIVASYVAAYGWPKNVDVGDDEKLLAWYSQRRARLTTIGDRLRQGVVAALVSIGLVTFAAGIAWLAPAKTPDPTLKITLSHDSTRCGLLLAGNHGGQLRLRLPDGSVAVVPLANAVKVEPVTSC
jgi:hypothetical protein